MLSSNLLTGLRAVRGATVSARNLGVMAPALQKATDPIQQLFVDKIREYQKKSTGGKLVEPSPAIERELKAELEKLAKVYGGSGPEMQQFPTIKFTDPTIDPINAGAAAAK